MVPIMGTMGVIRNKPRHGKDGTVQDYYYLVENHWENGKTKQKVVKYLGISPNTRELPINPAQAGPLAQALMSGAISTEEALYLINCANYSIFGLFTLIDPPVIQLLRNWYFPST
jgi:hypothetical protein